MNGNCVIYRKWARPMTDEHKEKLIIPMSLLREFVAAHHRFEEMYEAERAEAKLHARRYWGSGRLQQYARRVEQLQMQIEQLANEWVVEHGVEDRGQFDRNMETQYYQLIDGEAEYYSRGRSRHKIVFINYLGVSEREMFRYRIAHLLNPDLEHDPVQAVQALNAYLRDTGRHINWVESHEIGQNREDGLFR